MRQKKNVSTTTLHSNYNGTSCRLNIGSQDRVVHVQTLFDITRLKGSRPNSARERQTFKNLELTLPKINVSLPCDRWRSGHMQWWMIKLTRKELSRTRSVVTGGQLNCTLLYLRKIKHAMKSPTLRQEQLQIGHNGRAKILDACQSWQLSDVNYVTNLLQPPKTDVTRVTDWRKVWSARGREKGEGTISTGKWQTKKKKKKDQR